MDIARIADVDGYSHPSVRQTESSSLCVAHRRPQVVGRGLVIRKLHEEERQLQRQFDARNPGLTAVYDAYAAQPAADQRCAALALFEQDQPWATLFNGFTRSIEVTYRAHHGVDFCPTPP